MKSNKTNRQRKTNQKKKKIAFKESAERSKRKNISMKTRNNIGGVFQSSH